MRAADDAAAAIETHAEMICGEVLTVSLAPVGGQPSGTLPNGALRAAPVEFGIAVAVIPDA